MNPSRFLIAAGLSLVSASITVGQEKVAPSVPAAATKSASAFKMPAWVQSETAALVKMAQPSFEAWYAGLQQKLAAEKITSPADIKRVATQIVQDAQAEVGREISRLQAKAKQAAANVNAGSAMDALKKAKEAAAGLTAEEQKALQWATDRQSKIAQFLSELAKKV